MNQYFKEINFLNVATGRFELIKSSVQNSDEQVTYLWF